MRNIIENNSSKMPVKELLRKGFYSGIAWSFGVTVGFAVISTILVFVLKSLGGLPLVGSAIASIVQATLDQLVQNSPIFNN